jgi:WD40 repeat protein
MIAISATYDNDFRNRRTDIYLMQDDETHIRCLTDTQLLSSCDGLQWLGQRGILFRSHTPIHPTARYYTLDVITSAVRPFIPDLNPQSITAVTADGTIFFPGHRCDLTASMHGSLDDCSEIVVEDHLVAISSDGQWVAYYKAETPNYVYLQKLNTSHLQKIPMSVSEPPTEHDGDSRTVVWSPDGRYLAYQADYQDLWVMRADGTQRRKVSHLNHFWLKFRWSPDSTSIAFIGSVPAAQGGGPGVAAAPLYVTSIDDPAPQQLATLYKNDDSGGSWDWMSDAQHIVYATHLDGEAKLYKVNIHSHTQQTLVDTKPFAAIYDVAASS